MLCKMSIVAYSNKVQVPDGVVIINKKFQLYQPMNFAQLCFPLCVQNAAAGNGNLENSLLCHGIGVKNVFE